MKIAIVKLSALGDIIHLMVVLQFIKQQRPDIIIDWVVERSFKGILEHNPDINQIHCVNLKQAKRQKSIRLFFAECRKIKQFGQYDLVIDAQGLLKSGIVAKLLDAKKIIGFDKNSIRESIANWFYDKKIHIAYDENIIKRNATLINFALDLNISQKDILNKQAFLYQNSNYDFDCLSNDKKNVLLVIGASFECKKYPLQKYAELTQKLDANFIVLWGNKIEHKQAQILQKLTPTINLSPKLLLNELKYLISEIDLVIGGDTGPTHIAWALNKPSITLFGATSGHRNGCGTDINIIIESDSKVNSDKIDKNDLSIGEIKVQTILNEIKPLLGL